MVGINSWDLLLLLLQEGIAVLCNKKCVCLCLGSLSLRVTHNFYPSWSLTKKRMGRYLGAKGKESVSGLVTSKYLESYACVMRELDHQVLSKSYKETWWFLSVSQFPGHKVCWDFGTQKVEGIF